MTDAPLIDLTLGPQADSSARARSWIFTVNNPKQPVVLDALPGLIYGVYQLESGELGTPHYQGYLHFGSSKSRRQLSKLVPHSFLEPARGTPEQCHVYCTKDTGRLAEPVVFGVLPVQGKRNDLVVFRDAVLNGISKRELILDNDLFRVYARHPQLADRIRFDLATPRFLDHAPRVSLLIGAPGTGKSHWCRALYPDAYYLPDDGWWSGYTGERCVVLDDFAGSHLTFTSLKLVLDKGPYTCRIKCSHVQLEASEFVITSNYHPKHWYSGSVLGDHGEAAILRRITRVIEFTGINALTEYNSEEAQEWLANDNNSFKYK